jgi:hypothetical protein
MDFSKLPSLQPFKLSAPLRQFIVPKAATETHWNDTQIDPWIIVHPQQSKLGILPQGTILASNPFPNLKFLPIASPGSSSQAIPAQWPSFGVEQIPTTWPKFKLTQVQSAKPVTPLPPSK